MSAGAGKLIVADRLETRIVDYDWRFVRERGDEIDAHWRRRLGENPKLYDGPMMLACGVEERLDADGGRTLSVDFFETRFSRFLAWRDFGFPGDGALNCFAMAALRSADGAFLLGEMGPGHSVAGSIYFPAGTPDLSDVKDGGVDLSGSVARELAEETGLIPGPGDAASHWAVVFEGPRVACMKIIQSREDAATLKARVEAFIASDSDPELSAIHMISRRDQLDHPGLPGFMRRFLDAALTA